MREIITTCDICGKRLPNETQEISLPCKLIDNGEIFDISIEKVYLCPDCYFYTVNLCKDLNNKDNKNGHPIYFNRVYHINPISNKEKINV